MDEKELIKQKNKELCEKYPILIPHNRLTGKIRNDYDYEYTELDALDNGWLKAFGMKFVEELQDAINLLSSDLRDKIHILQIKEKFGYLHVYMSHYTPEIREVINKYEQLSKYTCVSCGKKATKISRGWICPWCDECSEMLHDDLIDINEFYKEDEDD